MTQPRRRTLLLAALLSPLPALAQVEAVPPDPAPAPPEPARLPDRPGPMPPAAPPASVPLRLPPGMETLPQGGWRLRFPPGTEAVPEAAAAALHKLGHRLAAATEDASSSSPRPAGRRMSPPHGGSAWRVGWR
ncbi:hypothetical protein ACFQU2_21445 [Siccirubricoccus deserti]